MRVSRDVGREGSLLIGLPLAFFAYNLSSDGFDWFSLPLGAGALLMLTVAIQLFTEDEADETDAPKSPEASL
jgi:hypothetical protein